MPLGMKVKGCPRAAFFCFKATLCAFMLGGAMGVMAQAPQGLPNPQITPGAVDPAITSQNLQSTVCVRGYTATVRPD